MSRESARDRWFDHIAEMTETASPASQNGSGAFRPAPNWPVLGDDAYYGLAGDIVKTIEPHSEADPVAVLTTLLSAVGNMVGRGTFFKVGADRHHLKVNASLIGETSKGRKGMSWNYCRDLLKVLDAGYIDDRVVNGLSSGEGLIYAVRDEVVGTDKDGDPVTVDPGVKDKRLLVMEGEFANVLKMCQREGNILSIIIRSAWDDGKLQTLTKGNPTKATNAHISIIGHITRVELQKLLSQSDSHNGFANRFLWMLVKRSKKLPFGGDWSSVDVAPIITDLRGIVDRGGKAGEMIWGYSARDLWVEVYDELSEGHPGLFGAITSRSEAQVMRIAAIYALLDMSRTIEEAHLKAGLAVWKYAEASVRYVFGNATGDPVADKIEEALRVAGEEGLSQNDLVNLFDRHQSSHRISQALETLQTANRIKQEQVPTGGRPKKQWFLK